MTSMQRFNQFPYHTILMAIFPVISLMAKNSGQINLVYIIRPLIISIVLSIIVLFSIFKITKDWTIAGLIATPIIISSSTFSILYRFVQDKTLLGIDLGHRSIILVFIIFLLGGLSFIIIKNKKNLQAGHQFFTVLGIVAVLLPTSEIAYYNIATNIHSPIPEKTIENEFIGISAPTTLPDIYYFILDGYTRADRLERTFKFDNTKFINELRQMGFYIADCSRSNYAHTRLSLASSLNMDYLSELAPELTPDVKNNERVDELIHRNIVRNELSKVGYKFVSFQTGYLFTEFHDADYYFATSSITLHQPFITPFEKLLLNDSVFMVLEIFPSVKLWLDSSSQSENYLIEKNKIEMLTDLDLPSPKFVFIHLNTAHRPYVFTPNGDFQTDIRFYSKDNGWPINQGLGSKGYINGIQYLNNSLIPIIKRLQSSTIPPIIIIQGDHGFMNFDQTEIINAYYFPDQNYQNLYPKISPVNSFRVVFNQYFDRSYGLLPDRSFRSELTPNPFDIKETSEKLPGCIGE